MSTATLEEAPALRSQVTATVLSVVATSGSALGVVLLAPHAPGSGSVTLPLEAESTRASRTCCGVADGFADTCSAAAPTTCGVAIDVPEIVLVAVFEPIT